MNKTIIGIIIGAIVIASGSFFAGMKYDQSKNPALTTGGRFANFGGGNGGQRNGIRQNGGFTAGQIIGKDDKSIIVKMNDGSSKIVFFSASTEITKYAAGTLTDLLMNANVAVTGTPNSDGSITAQTIQLRPADSLPFGGQPRTSQ